jgi:hypothetical protein
MSITIIAAMAALLLPIQGMADSVHDPGGGFVGQKKSKLGKNYYVVRKENGCAITTGKLGEKPEGAIGDAPYASKNYAKAALKDLPECKGKLVEDEFGGKKQKKDKSDKE